MSENVSPNKSITIISDKCLKKILINNLIDSEKRSINSMIELDNEVMTSKTNNKKLKNQINDECVECVHEMVDNIDCQQNDTQMDLRTDSSQLFPSINSEDIKLLESVEQKEVSLLTNKLIDCENKSQLEIELYLIEDCMISNPRVFAQKTTEEQKIEYNSLGLILNTDYINKSERMDKRMDNKSSVKYSTNKKYNSLINYEVESIYDSSIEQNTNKILYSVKWKNWKPKYNTWEPISHLNNCLQLVNEFKYIQKLQDNKHLITIYRNFYRLKGIIEDMVEKKVDQNTLLTILLIFNQISLRDFNYTKVSIKKMRTDLKNCNEVMDEVSKVPKMKTRIDKMEKEFNKLVAKLNILKKFDSLEKFFDFFEKRKSLQTKLNKWENEINGIIRKENEGQVITLENYVDLELPPHNFDYIVKCKTINTSIIVNDDPPLYCQCNDCETEQEECCVSSYQLPIVYNKNGILKDSRNIRHAIYECNKKCKCSIDCINRVIQKGRKHKLAIFRTDDGKGWGVRALEPIPKGSFVMEYIGEIITIEEADRRGAIYDAEGRTYLFDLDYTPDEETDFHKYAVDATQCGNVSHFVNHSCEPNLDTRVAWINNLDPFMPHIALFAVRHIRMNEELTFDYKINVHGITDINDSIETIQNQFKIPEDHKDLGEYAESGHISDDSGISQMTNDKNDVQKLHENNRINNYMVFEKIVNRVTCKCGAKTCKKYLY